MAAGANPAVLAETVRQTRAAIDADLAALRAEVRKADPRRVDVARWARSVAPWLGGALALWWWSRRRRSVRTLDRLLAHDLTRLQLGERRLESAMERLGEKATDPELRRALAHRRELALAHTDRLTRIFELLGTRPARRVTSDPLSAVVADATALLNERAAPAIVDARLIGMARRIAHMQMAGYDAAERLAGSQGHEYAAALLHQTHEEERSAHDQLTFLADQIVRGGTPRAHGRA